MINLDLTDEEFSIIKRMRQDKINPYDYIDIMQVTKEHEVERVLDSIRKGDYEDITNEDDDFSDRYANGMDGSNDRDNKNWGFGS